MIENWLHSEVSKHLNLKTKSKQSNGSCHNNLLLHHNGFINQQFGLTYACLIWWGGGVYITYMDTRTVETQGAGAT